MRRYTYDAKNYPLSEIALGSIQKHYPDVQDLSLLHEYVPAKKIGELAKIIGKDLADTNFYEIFDKLLNDYVSLGEILVQRFGNIRINIPNQDKDGTVLPFHQGQWVGNGLGLRTIWLPFTDAYDSNSLQIVNLMDSREITNACKEWDYPRLQEECQKSCEPVNIKKGQFILFTQEHIHGAAPNRTGKTRMSIDVRLLLKGGQPHRKWPGAYFRKLGDTNIHSRKVEIKHNDNVVMYAEYEGFKTRYIDLHFQTLTVKDYCNRMGYTFPHQTGDNEGRKHTYLEYLIQEGNLDHIMMFSIFSLPDDYHRRDYIMRLAVALKVKLHFANEEFVLDSWEMLDKIEYLRNFTTDWSNPVYESSNMALARHE
tara:strand:- start:165 stop:1268 length:1104 start_codon:yes stop_codon:yes gene_type:complete